MTTTTAARARRGHLLKILGVSFGIAVAVGNVIGSGILRAPASIAGTVPDFAWIMALWVLGAAHAALAVNIISELATAVPQSGGPYLYAHRAFGDVAGLVVGWSIWIAKLAGIAAGSISFAEFLPLIWPAAAGFKTAVAIAMQVAFYGANVLGLREGRVLQEGTSLIKVLMLLAFAGAAVAVAGPHDAAGTSSSVSVSFGWIAIIGAYSLIKGAYSGFDAPVYFTEENEQPASSIPRSLGIGLFITAFVYIAVNAALLYALGAKGTAATPLPFGTVLDRIGGVVPAILFAIGAMAAVAGVVNAGVMSAPRLIFALARDKLLPGFFQSVNRGGTPDMATLMTAAASIALAATGSFALVFGLIAILDTLGSVLIEGSLFVLRRKEPDLPRPFRAIGYPLLPALLLAVDLVLFVLFAGSDWKGLAFAAGLSIICVPFAMIARRAKWTDDQA
jgi:APA family basic amino acid/polyamine antiporter